MPTKASTHRVLVSLERPLFRFLSASASAQNLSLSQRARDLILHALESEEDLAIDTLVRDRKGRSKRGYSIEETRRRLAAR